MRNILKRHSGTPSGTRFEWSKSAKNWHFLCGGENPRILGFGITFILLNNFIESMGLFDVFKDEDKDENSGGTAEETPSFESEPEPTETPSFESEPEPTETPSTEPTEETTSYSQTGTAVQSQLGIEGLMDKRHKVGEAIDYVGSMIKELREKRANLQKSIEDESVDIKNLKEKLTKISQFIQEENDGLQELTRKRSEVEKDADEVGNIVYSLRDKITEIDKVVADEASRISSFKSSKG